MAPEQLAGREVSVKSDLFALGLVLYEVFTGKRAFDAPTVGELVKQHERGAPTPTTAVPDLDPRSTGRSCAASRAIRPCVQRRPSRSRQAFQAPAHSRRRSRRARPSPRWSPPQGRLARSRKAARSCWRWVRRLIAASAVADRSSVLSRTPPFKTTPMLADQAEQMIQRLGYPLGVDAVFGFDENEEYLRHIARADQSIDRWRRVSAGPPPAITFWCRTSPREMLPWGWEDQAAFGDPPMIYSDMVRLSLDAAGRLVYFEAVPRRVPDTPRPDATASGAPAHRYLGSALPRGGARPEGLCVHVGILDASPVC